MRAVAIDAATRRAGVALWEDGTIVAFECSEEWSRHAERLIEVIDRCFAKAGWSPQSVDACVAGIGPGSFTGARVGLATAKGLALALNRPLVGVVSLDAMAAAVLPFRAPEPRILALLDAGRQELFASVYAASGERRAGPFLVRPGEIQGQCFDDGSETTLVLGEASGLSHVAAELARPGVRVLRTWGTDLPDPGAVARVGMARITGGPRVQAQTPAEGGGAPTATDELADLEPFYVRAPDITKPNEG